MEELYIQGQVPHEALFTDAMQDNAATAATNSGNGDAMPVGPAAGDAMPVGTAAGATVPVDPAPEGAAATAGPHAATDQDGFTTPHQTPREHTLPNAPRRVTMPMSLKRTIGQAPWDFQAKRQRSGNGLTNFAVLPFP